LLLATAGIGVLMFLFMLPTVRVNRFARLIDAGSTADVIAMLDGSIGENDAYRSMLEHVCSIPPDQREGLETIRIEPLTISQLLGGTRRVVVGQGWGGGEVEFVVGWRRITKGRNWLQYE
jgi:hypothetical protein